MSKAIEKILSEYRDKKPVIRALIVRDKINKDERTVELSFSSESPVERWYGFEVLDHSAGACDLERLNSGAPLLVNHNPNDQVGVVVSAQIAADRKGRAVVKFSRSERGEEIFQDVLDGIRTTVSVGYDVLEMVLDKQEAGKVETYKATRWSPLEISLASIPADTSVGVGRNKTNPQESEMKHRILLDPAATETAPGGGGTATVPPPAPKVNVTELRSAALKEERDRQKAYRELGRLYQCPDLAEKALDEEWSKEQLQNEILQTRFKAKPLTPAEEDTSIGMSRRDLAKYSVVRAMHARAKGERVSGLELEASNAVAKRLGREARGFFIPGDVAATGFAESKDLGANQRDNLADAVRGLMQVQQRTLTAGTATAGGILVGTDVLFGSMIELLRNQLLVKQLGARTLSGLSGNVVIPKQAGGGTAYWLGETEDVTLSDQSFGQLALTPKKLGAATRYSMELLRQASLDVEAFVRQDLMLILAIARDLAAIAGNGGDQPPGILNTTGIGSVTFGGAPTWAKVVEFETTTATANALAGMLAFLSSPGVRGKWKTTVKAANTAVFLLEGAQSNGYSFNATNQVAGNKVLFGNWADLILADWDGMDVTVDPYTGALGGTTRTVMFQMADSALRHPASMTVSSDSGAQ